MNGLASASSSSEANASSRSAAWALSIGTISGYTRCVQIKEEFDVGDVDMAQAIVRAHPFATLVTSELRATHMPCLVDEQSQALTILGHVARADPAAERLQGPLLAIFQGAAG